MEKEKLMALIKLTSLFPKASFSPEDHEKRETQGSNIFLFPYHKLGNRLHFIEHSCRMRILNLLNAIR